LTGFHDLDFGWILNGERASYFDGCMDIDILPSPFTNTLPIRRLDFQANPKHEISVLYIDLIEQKVSLQKQIYTKLSETDYLFENMPNDFEADITVDEQGFVLGYPGLFRRI
jgi:uncharacterized protein